MPSNVDTIALLAALAIVPFVFMTATSFVKISVVLSIVRNAVGVAQVPSGTVIAALSFILTLYVMAPVGTQMSDAIAPALARIDRERPVSADGGDALVDAAEHGAEPLRAFLARNSDARNKQAFLDLARRARPEAQRAAVLETDLIVLLPSFLVTELGEAFQIGFLVFLPFLLLDMLIANILLALGMHMLSPTTVSLPFKLLLFVAADGWYLLARALVLGYA